jgi:prevent-host-death family protein
MVKVNVAALKAELSKYLEMAHNGNQVIVTSHGEEIARIGPAQTVVTAPINWKSFFSKYPSIKPKKKGTPTSQHIHDIREED